MPGPLAGIKVLDFTWALAGPYCTMLLADLGAEVVKVENPEGGDPSRGNSPFIQGISSYFLSVNRGKKSITANLRHPRGKEMILKLAEFFDVWVENFRPGVLERLGLGYGAVRSRNPKIIYASCSGFGQDSPYAHRPAYDVIVQGMAGTLSITGEEGGPPVRVGYSIGDIGGGVFTAMGILAALHERAKSAEGQRVDVSMLDSQIAFLENAFARFLATGEEPRRIGTRHPVMTPFQAFPTKDGYMVLAAARDQFWEKFCKAVEREDLLKDERFQNLPSRNRHQKALEHILSEITRGRTTAEWVAEMEKNDIPCAPINTVGKMAKDPHTLKRQMITEVRHPRAGALKVVGSPIKLSRTPVQFNRASPDLGEHTEEILKEILGYSDPEIAELRAEKVI